jgi:pilus assembly protein CpaB
MHNRSTTIIGAGVAVAVLGAVLVFVYARSLQGSSSASGAPGAAAWVARTAIPAGTQGGTITPDVQEATVPATARPSDAITNLGQINGLVSLRPIEVGEVVTISEFGTAGTPSVNTSGLAIPAGTNAMTVNVPIPQNVAGYVTPGDLVNVYLSSKDIGATPAVRLLLSNVTVLAVVVEGTPSTTTPTPVAGPQYFTLALTPAQSEKMIYAETFEQVWFALVHPGDSPVSSGGIVPSNLFS